MELRGSSVATGGKLPTARIAGSKRAANVSNRLHSIGACFRAPGYPLAIVTVLSLLAGCRPHFNRPPHPVHTRGRMGEPKNGVKDSDE